MKRSDKSPAAERLGRWAFLHVRRGDYAKLQHTHPLLPMTYYDRAVREFGADVRFLVFCEQEDVAGVRKDFAALPDVLGRIGAWIDTRIPDYLQLMMMAHCGAGGIIANSSFSCWGAYLGAHLNGAATYVAPMQWFVDTTMNAAIAGACLPGWIRIPPDPRLPPLIVRSHDPPKPKPQDPATASTAAKAIHDPPGPKPPATASTAVKALHDLPGPKPRDPAMGPAASTGSRQSRTFPDPSPKTRDGAGGDQGRRDAMQLRRRPTQTCGAAATVGAMVAEGEEWRPRGVVWCGTPHDRNLEAMQKGCAQLGVPFRRVSNEQEARRLAATGNGDADVVWFMDRVVHSGAELSGCRVLYGPHVWYTDTALAQRVADKDAPRNAAFICLSKWNVGVYAEHGVHSTSAMPILDLPFGLDTDLFRPADGTTRDAILVYHKHRPTAHLDAALALLRKHHPGTEMIVFRYGSYTRESYRAALNRCLFGVWIGGHESQGFGLEEALSMDVPLIVWDVRSMYEELSAAGTPNYTRDAQNPKKLSATSAPYWDSRCGERVYDEPQLGAALQHIRNKCAQGAFQPRAYATQHLSIQVCARRLFQHLHLLTPKPAVKTT